VVVCGQCVIKNRRALYYHRPPRLPFLPVLSMPRTIIFRSLVAATPADATPNPLSPSGRFDQCHDHLSCITIV